MAELPASLPSAIILSAAMNGHTSFYVQQFP
jgi:hypothetical protein